MYDEKFTEDLRAAAHEAGFLVGVALVAIIEGLCDGMAEGIQTAQSTRTYLNKQRMH